MKNKIATKINNDYDKCKYNYYLQLSIYYFVQHEPIH